MRIYLKFFCLFAIFGFVTGIYAATGAVSGGYHVDNGDNATITAHSVTKKITNNHSSGATIYVPLTTSTEWTSFITNAAVGVTVEDPPPVCGGISVGGYCWYMGATNQSCDTVCSERGGCNAAGTVNYAGNGGTLANCDAVLDALLGAGTAIDSNGFFNGDGCTLASGSRRRYIEYGTSCASNASGGLGQRACACNN